MRLAKRLDRCQRRMSDLGASLMILSPSSNMRYMTKVEEQPSDRKILFLIPSRGEPKFLVPELESKKFEALNFNFVLYGSDDEFGDSLTGLIREIGVPEGKVLLDDKMWEEVSQAVREVMTGREFGLVSEVLKDLRAVKSEEEINNIKRASKIVDRVVQDIREMNAIGQTEKQFANFIENKMSDYGGEGSSFDTIVAAGENGANPHHRPTEREIVSGEMVVLDFGCWVNGYASDQTRTLAFGDEHPSRETHEVHDIVRTAQEQAVQSVKPGIKAGQVDKVARDIIEEAGYGDEFIHRTGHGVGMEVHENPEIKKGNDEMLRPGMVFSVEPGIYLENKFGVRIEDLVLVTENGFERLNKTSQTF